LGIHVRFPELCGGEMDKIKSSSIPTDENQQKFNYKIIGDLLKSKNLSQFSNNTRLTN
jgi:hypothetical protein